MIELRTLGPAAVTVDGEPAAPELLWRKNLALLIYLARSPRRTRTREHLMGLLWGDKPATSARHSLREAIRILRSALGDSAVTSEGDSVSLDNNVVRLDVEELERAALAGETRRIAELAAGDFLEGFAVPDAGPFEDWLTAERQGVRRKMVDALAREAEAQAERGELTRSADLASRALALEPLSAGAARALMMSRALRGERAEALAAFEQFARACRDATGSGPDGAMLQLAERIRKERAPRVSAPPPRGAESRRAPLVGRDEQLGALLRAWHACRAGKASLLMIDGDAGTGRSRLAEEIGARARLDGAAIVQVRGAPADQGQPWSGVFGLARGGLLDAAGIAAAPPASLAAFASRIDEWGDRFASLRGAQPAVPGAAFADIARAAAAEQPLMLIADDAHHLDADSIAALQSVLRDGAKLPVAVVLTAAPVPPREDLEQLRSRVGRDVPGTIVRLERLGGDALRALAQWAMPSYAPAAAERLARRIGADSAGLPLLAVELLHAVALGLDLGSETSAWPAPHRTLEETLPGDLPEAIVAAIRIGFRRLSPNAQLVVGALSELGSEATTPTLARATGLAASAVADALDECEWQRWLVADGRGYAFLARLTRDVVARDLVTPGQRRRYKESLTAP